MANDFKFPDIGEGITEGEVVKWLASEGDKVEADQPIVEVETDKALVELPSPYSGTVLKIHVKEKDIIKVGNVLVTLGEEAPLWIAVDDRLTSNGFGDLESWVEMITYRFPCGIEWADTGDNLTVEGDNDRQLSVFLTTTNLPAGTYDFAMNPLGRNFYTMGTVPEPMTIALLGLGGLGLIRRKRS